MARRIARHPPRGGEQEGHTVNDVDPLARRDDQRALMIRICGELARLVLSIIWHLVSRGSC